MANEFEISFQGVANLYTILRRGDDASVYNGEAFVTWSDGDITTYAQPLTHRGGDVYQGDFPAAAAAGRYRVLYYLRQGSTPAITDLLLSTRTLYWNTAPDAETPEPVAVNDDALTSVEAMAAYLRLASLTSSDQALLASLVNEVSARIERICGRRFKARRWVDRDARGITGQLTLRHYPILSIHRLATGCENVMLIRCDKAGTLKARVAIEYDDQGLNGQLRLSSTSSAGEDTLTDISMQTCPTVAMLAAAVEEVEGWSAQVIVNCPSQELYPLGGLGALDRALPIVRPSQELQWWDCEHATGRINLWRQAGRMLVDYRAGYETIPADVRLATTELVAQAYQQGRRNPSLHSETLGDYSYTLATQTQINDELWSRLRLYMEVR